MGDPNNPSDGDLLTAKLNAAGAIEAKWQAPSAATSNLTTADILPNDALLEKEATYIVRNNNGIFEAINGHTGITDFTSTVFETLIASVDANMPNGGIIHVKTGTYAFNKGGIILNSSAVGSSGKTEIIFEGEGQGTILQYTGTASAIGGGVTVTGSGTGPYTVKDSNTTITTTGAVAYGVIRIIANLTLSDAATLQSISGGATFTGAGPHATDPAITLNPPASVTTFSDLINTTTPKVTIFIPYSTSGPVTNAYIGEFTWTFSTNVSQSTPLTTLQNEYHTESFAITSVIQGNTTPSMQIKNLLIDAKQDFFHTGNANTTSEYGTGGIMMRNISAPSTLVSHVMIRGVDTGVSIACGNSVTLDAVGVIFCNNAVMQYNSEFAANDGVLHDPSGLIVNDCTWSGARHNGVWIAPDAVGGNDYNELNTVVEGCGVATRIDGGYDQVSIKNVYIEGAGPGIEGNTDYYLKGGSGTYPVKNVVIENCRSNTNGPNMFKLNYATNVTIKNCRHIPNGITSSVPTNIANYYSLTSNNTNSMLLTTTGATSGTIVLQYYTTNSISTAYGGNIWATIASTDPNNVSVGKISVGLPIFHVVPGFGGANINQAVEVRIPYATSGAVTNVPIGIVTAAFQATVSQGTGTITAVIGNGTLGALPSVTGTGASLSGTDSVVASALPTATGSALVLCTNGQLTYNLNIEDCEFNTVPLDTTVIPTSSISRIWGRISDGTRRGVFISSTTGGLYEGDVVALGTGTSNLLVGGSSGAAQAGAYAVMFGNLPLGGLASKPVAICTDGITPVTVSAPAQVTITETITLAGGTPSAIVSLGTPTWTGNDGTITQVGTILAVTPRVTAIGTSLTIVITAGWSSGIITTKAFGTLTVPFVLNDAQTGAAPTVGVATTAIIGGTIQTGAQTDTIIAGADNKHWSVQFAGDTISTTVATTSGVTNQSTGIITSTISKMAQAIGTTSLTTNATILGLVAGSITAPGSLSISAIPTALSFLSSNNTWAGTNTYTSQTGILMSTTTPILELDNTGGSLCQLRLVANNVGPLIQIQSSAAKSAGSVIETQFSGFTGTPINLSVLGIASAVNYLQAKSSITTADPTISALGTDGDINIALTAKGNGYVTYTRNKLASAPANPTATTSVTKVMMGLGSTLTLTPRRTGTVRVILRCLGSTATGLTTWNVQPYHGIGGAPANGAALTGTADATSDVMESAATGTNTVWYNSYEITGLTVGTAYWFDISLATGNVSDAASITNIRAIIEEL